MTVCEVANDGKMILLIVGVNGNFCSRSSGNLSANNKQVIMMAPKMSMIKEIVKIKIEIHELAAIPMMQNRKPTV
eukprot:CAMPEP_0197024156 /NCGR_PEP_ID=MMETSP1384-20130603/4791_1 /TAXON_ID=29189 /ORGANISM="Ammonia sp." /LENGTH=74 /DNA_ID=CAMNT_0042452501 /DNA_START=74 /DNA_END=298 /DNA_ORIENTATION=-